ncbi:HAMP domain-containing sensor histidine kinase [uncultured Roseobacter sp.]|uniref:sensor histidine kinase n=1 Tax=uncultured Roseobacter sp. TaxID=114847 RepID=UPI00260A364B|nr:HAMP domain-containing sensor histidine kinase [uncultured Roseobacter sp.]
MSPNSDQCGMAQAGTKDHMPSTEIEDFIYLISHDVRNSVRALIELPHWIAEDLQDAGVKLDGSVGESIELMNRHTGRLDRMLVDLLTFSRVGRMQEVGQVDLDDALDEVLEEIRLPHGFQIIRNLSHHSVRCGERDILTLLTALISNAIKHHDSPTGKIVVSSERAGGSVVLTVSDDGPGIAPRYREKVFGAMTTLKPRDEVEGSGMGLAITRKIAQVYEGHARLNDPLDARGIAVEVSLPDGPQPPCEKKF